LNCGVLRSPPAELDPTILSKQQFNQAVFTVYAPLRNQFSTCSDTMFDFQISKEEFVEEFCREDEKKFL